MTVLKRDARAPDAVETPEAALRAVDRLLEMPLTLTVVVCEKDLRLEDLLKVRPGDVIEFEKNVEEPLAVEVNGRPIADGAAVKRGEKFALKVEAVVPVPLAIRAMGP